MEGRGFEAIEYVGTLSDNKITLFGKWYIKKTGVSGVWSATKEGKEVLKMTDMIMQKHI